MNFINPVMKFSSWINIETSNEKKNPPSTQRINKKNVAKKCECSIFDIFKDEISEGKGKVRRNADKKMRQLNVDNRKKCDCH